MLKYIRYFIFLCLIPAALLQAELTLELSRNKISADDTVDLILKSSDNSGPPSIPDIPLPDGLSIIGTSRQESVINFKHHFEVRYTLRADKADSYQIGPFKLSGQKNSEQIPALTLTVSEPKTVRATDNLFVTLESSSTDLLVHQTVELTLSVYSRVSIGNMNILDFPDKGLEISEWQQIQAQSKQIGQKVYRVSRFVAQLTPTTTGSLTLDPNFKVDIIDQSDPFGMMFGSRSSRSVRLNVQEPVVLKVKNPPEAGRPKNYNGHLGNFRLSARISPREVKVGDPVTLRVELSGTGSLQQALPPGLKESDDFKVYQPKLVTEDMEKDGLSGRKIIEQVLIPKHAGVKEVPALTFSYYDTSSKSYKTLQAGPFPLTVLKSGDSMTANTISSLPQTAKSTEPTVLGEDLIYLKTRPGKIRSASSLNPSWGLAGLSGFPFAVWALMGLVLHQREKQETDLVGHRRQQAPRRLRKHLQMLESKAEDIHASIWDVLSEYLSARLDLPPGELNPPEVSVQLESQVSPQTLEEMQNWMRDCEHARFSGGIDGENSEKIREEFKAFILKLDRELGR